LIEPHVERVPKAEKGIACKPLAALDTLEQEPRLERRELQVGRYRGIEVCCDVEWL